jgi:4-hydroxythreonine-4-phosphate dehydrogenase
MAQRPTAITMGDPAGIGPEIVARLFAEGAGEGCIVIGDVTLMRRAVTLVGASLAVIQIDGPAAAHPGPGPGRIEVIAASDLPSDFAFGRIDARAGAAAFAYIARAIDEVMEGRIAAIVTAPISKKAMNLAGIDYPGHTEILAERSGTRDFAMMLANDELRVLLVSIHLSLADAIRAVTPETELRAIRLADRAVRQFGIARPRVAVAGLNPHAGEDGMFGTEDAAIIAPAIAQARQEGIDASGPYPGDTVFMRARRGEFDVVVAQYHDQGLIPIKYLGLDHGVNITVGLPFVRTSVDHGTAFDIAGKGMASAASLRAAVTQAAAMVAGQAIPPANQAGADQAGACASISTLSSGRQTSL